HERAHALLQIYAARDAYARPSSRTRHHDASKPLVFKDPVNHEDCRVVRFFRFESALLHRFHDHETGEYGFAEEQGLNPEDLAGEADVRAMENEAAAQELGLDFETATLMGVLPRAPLELKPEVHEFYVEYYMSPDGYVLSRRLNPYDHQQPSYRAAFTTWVDGSFMGLFEPALDPARYSNRIHAMIDKMLLTSARGLLMIGEDQLPDGWTIDNVAEKYVQVGSVLVYKASANKPPPQQVTTASIPVGLFQWFQQQGVNQEEFTGINGAFQGFTPDSQPTATQFMAQIQQSGVTTLDFFECCYEAFRDLDVLLAQTVMQAYEPGRWVRSGKAGQPVQWDPGRVRDLEVDAVQADVAETATHRLIFEEDLNNWLQSNRITWPEFLSNSGHPRAQAFLEGLEQDNPLFNGEINPAQLEQLVLAADSGNPDAVALLSQAQENPTLQLAQALSSAQLGATPQTQPAPAEA
ncbi:MAG: hypothetical protein AAFV01_05515, partial [Bacteroidota bacterium]